MNAPSTGKIGTVVMVAVTLRLVLVTDVTDIIRDVTLSPNMSDSVVFPVYG